MPDFMAYHRSVTDELDALKNKIRNLVTHWPTDGEWKEAVIRTMLRRHLPPSHPVGRGFIVDRGQSSTQIDILTLRPESPTLFRDGDLTIVTPDAPSAVAEVKTSPQGYTAWVEVAVKLVEHGRRCRDVARNHPWLGIFSFEGVEAQVSNALNALCTARQETGVSINCVCIGYDYFIRYWPKGQVEPGDPPRDAKREYWRAYHLEHLAPSYFLSNMVDGICNVDRVETDYAWFAHQGGKGPHKIDEKRAEECNPD